MLKKIEIKTDRYISFIDISRKAKEFVSESGINDGLLLIYTPHTTAGITVNENADPDVTSDIRNFISKKISQEGYFTHFEGNSPSHIMSSLFSASETFIIDKGEILLGRWQGIYFCEFDGPRTRKVLFKVLGK